MGFCFNMSLLERDDEKNDFFRTLSGSAFTNSLKIQQPLLAKVLLIKTKQDFNRPLKKSVM